MLNGGRMISVIRERDERVYKRDKLEKWGGEGRKRRDEQKYKTSRWSKWDYGGREKTKMHRITGIFNGSQLVCTTE